MDPVGLVQGALTPLQRARDAIQGATDVKTNLRRRYGDYSSVLEPLKNKPDVIAAYEIERELRRLTELFSRIADLISENTAAPADGTMRKFSIHTKRAADYRIVNKKLDEIDVDVMRQLAIMNLKGAISSSEMEVLQGVDAKVDRLAHLVNEMRPPSLPDKAAVPAGALALPRSYVERAGVQKAVGDLIDPEKALAPYTVVGMGGGGKTVLASAVVRKSSAREYFRGGIFWMGVGRDAKNSLLPLLQGLAREMGAAPADTPHGVPHNLDGLEQVKQHLTTVASTGAFPRLVVLDDVWEREVMDAFLPLGLKVLVTTRDRSVVGVPGGLQELGDMEEDEALELLLKTSRTVGRPGSNVRTHMTQVVSRCGRLPLVLAIAGSMPVVKGKGLVAGAWEELIKLLENAAKMMRVRGEQSSSLNTVLEASFDALAERKQEEVLKTAVLAAGTVAPPEMLRNLWEIKDTKGTREEAEGLVSKSLLQDVGGGGYRVHDLVLKFVKIKIKADAEMVGKAKELQAQYLGRLDVVKGYGDPEHGAGSQGWFVLDALWRSLEKLSGDPGLEVASYSASLEELESSEATEEVASCFALVGALFFIQGKYAEAVVLNERCQAKDEKVHGPEHPNVATTLNNRAELLRAQGKFSEAEPLYERAQKIFEKSLGRDHPNVATILNNRAGLLSEQGKYAEAEPLYARCQAIEEKVLGPEHPRLATTLNNRAVLLERQGKYDEADPLYLRAIEIGEKTLGPDHPDLATRLSNRAALLEQQGKYAEAEPLHTRATEIWEKASGPEHPLVATALNNRAGLLYRQGKYNEAEPLYVRAIAIGEKALGPEHPNLATWLNNRAELLSAQGKYDEAERLYGRSLAIREKVLGPEHPDVAASLNNRAMLLEKQGKYAEAEPLYERCQAIEEKVLGPDHPSLAITLNNRAGLLHAQGKYSEAKPLFKRSLAIREKVYEPDHPAVATALSNLASLLESQGNHDEVDPLHLRVIDIYERTVGPDHPRLASALRNRASRLTHQCKYAEAGPLYERSQAIREKVLGPEHPDVAQSHNDRAWFFYKQGQHAKAIPLLRKALSIRTKKLGENHPDTVDTRSGLKHVVLCSCCLIMSPSNRVRVATDETE